MSRLADLCIVLFAVAIIEGLVLGGAVVRINGLVKSLQFEERWGRSMFVKLQTCTCPKDPDEP